MLNQAKASFQKHSFPPKEIYTNISYESVIFSLAVAAVLEYLNSKILIAV